MRAFLREVLAEWQRDDCVTLGAALAYYAVFATAPLLVLAIAVAGLVFGRAAAEGEVVRHLTGAVGPDGAAVVQDLLRRASRPASGIAATVASLATTLVGATGAFGALEHALHRIWGVEPAARSALRAVVRRRLVAFAMVLGVGALLVVSVVLSTALAGVGTTLARVSPRLAMAAPWLEGAASLGLLTLLFALVYKTLAGVPLAWRDAGMGALVTAALFAGGKALVASYLARASVASLYGAAGSLVLLVLWVYYAAQSLLVGAEITEVWSRRRRERG